MSGNNNQEENKVTTNNLIGRIIDHVSANLSKDLHQKTVAGLFRISVVTLRSLFKKKFECTYQQYVERERMKHAYTLIAKEGKRIKEAMYMSGYHNRSTFIRVFKRHFHKLPSDFK